MASNPEEKMKAEDFSCECSVMCWYCRHVHFCFGFDICMQQCRVKLHGLKSTEVALAWTRICWFAGKTYKFRCASRDNAQMWVQHIDKASKLNQPKITVSNSQASEYFTLIFHIGHNELPLITPLCLRLNQIVYLLPRNMPSLILSSLF